LSTAHQTCIYNTTSTTNPFNGLFSTTTWVSQYQKGLKGKTILDLNEARDDGVWGCSGINWTIQSALTPDNHTNTSSLNFTGWILFLMPNHLTNSVKALKSLGAVVCKQNVCTVSQKNKTPALIP